MIIRNYKNEDIGYIVKLGKVLHENYVFKLDVFSDCLVLIVNDNIVGFITYSIIYERAEIIDIVIDENHRNHGYGKKLLDSVINKCKSNRCSNVTLEVSKSNDNAISFYLNYGFKIISTRQNYYLNDHSDAYVMVLEVI